jgi:hypothetical protein
MLAGACTISAAPGDKSGDHDSGSLDPAKGALAYDVNSSRSPAAVTMTSESPMCTSAGRSAWNRVESQRRIDAPLRPPADRVWRWVIYGFQSFLEGITITTISVRMLKNRPRMPQPNGLRPFIAAMAAQMIAAMMLPIATKMPLMPRRIKPAASGWLYAASTN